MAAGLGFKTFTTGEVLTSADVNGYLMQGVLVFASAAARNAAITSPQEGQFAFTKDTNGLWYYDGAAWVASGATGDIEGVTAGVGITGGGTSGTVTVTNDMATTITAAGDIVVGTGSGTYDNLPIGTTAQVLTADTTVSPYKVKWATPSGSSFSGARCHKASDQAVTASTWTQLTWDTEEYDTSNYHDLTTNTDRFTVPTTGYYSITITTSSSNGGTNAARYYNIRQASNSMVMMAEKTSQLEIGNTIATSWYLTSGQYVTIRVYQASGVTQTFFGDGNYGVDQACTFAINFLGA